MSCGTTFENNPLPPEVICPDPELCDEIIEAGCVAYSGAPVQCAGAQEGVLLSTIFNTIISRVLNCCPCVVCEDITYDISHITASQFRIDLSSPSPMISHTLSDRVSCYQTLGFQPETLRYLLLFPSATVSWPRQRG